MTHRFLAACVIFIDRSARFALKELTKFGGLNRMTLVLLSLNLRKFWDIQDLMSERHDLSLTDEAARIRGF